MKEKIEALREKFQSQLAEVNDANGLEELRLSFMSKKGLTQSYLHHFRTILISI